MEPIETAAALSELARAASRLAELLVAQHSGAGVEPAPADGGSAWRSPTHELEPVIVAGEGDLADALGRGHGCLVNAACGGLVPATLSEVERISRLAVTLVGDVALEAAHAGVQASGTTIDAMLAKGFAVLAASAEEAGVPVPAEVFVSAAERFSELRARGARWR